MHEPAQSTFLRLIGPPRHGRRADPAARRQADLPAEPARPADRRARPRAARHGRPGAVELPAADRPARRGQEPDRPRDRLPPLDQPRPRGGRPARRPVLRVRRAAAGPVVGRVLLPLRLRPGRRGGRAGAAGRLGVRAGDARGVGGDDRRGQHRPRRRAAVDQRHPRRAALAVPRGDRRDRRRPARVRRPAGLQPGLGRRDRHPGRVALAVPGHARGHEQLGGARAARRAGAARDRGDAPRSAADRRRGRAGVDAAVPRHRVAVADVASGSASAPRSRSSPPTSTSRCTAGKIQDAEAAAACRMLDQAGYGRSASSATSGLPNLHGYPRAVTS